MKISIFEEKNSIFEEQILFLKKKFYFWRKFLVTKMYFLTKFSIFDKKTRFLNKNLPAMNNLQLFFFVFDNFPKNNVPLINYKKNHRIIIFTRVYVEAKKIIEIFSKIDFFVKFFLCQKMEYFYLQVPLVLIQEYNLIQKLVV